MIGSYPRKAIIYFAPNARIIWASNYQGALGWNLNLEPRVSRDLLADHATLFSSLEYLPSSQEGRGLLVVYLPGA